MKTSLGDIGNKAKRTELYRKQKGNKKAEQKDRRRRREREAQELGEVKWCDVVFRRVVNRAVRAVCGAAGTRLDGDWSLPCGISFLVASHTLQRRSPSYNKRNLPLVLMQ